MRFARFVACIGLGFGLTHCHAITGLDDLGLRDDASSTVAASSSSSGGGADGGAAGTGAAGGAGATGATGAAGGTAGSGPSLCDSGEPLTYAQTVLCDEPAAYWRFEEADPPDALDETGQHPAQYVGTVSLDAEGIAGSRAPTFHANGQGYVLVGDVFDFVGNDAFTIEAWVKPVTPPDYAGIFGKFLDDGTEEQGYMLSLTPTNLNAVRKADGVVDSINTSTIPPDEFTHLVLTYDGKTMSIYKNGALAKGVESNVPLVDRDTPVSIGSYHGWGYFNGVIDEVAVYDKLLKATRIAAHYQAGAPD